MKRIFFRRRIEGKTDYKARRNLLMSGKPRIVIRVSNKYITTQIVESKEAQDFIISGVNSKELAEFGWKGSFKNIPASYLTGIMIGKKAAEKGINEIIFDIGMQRTTKGSRIYACLKGIIDAGISMNYGKEMIPGEERILGKHINEKLSEDIKKIKEKILK
jgi:large subunit ribosomal protein L18